MHKWNKCQREKILNNYRMYLRLNTWSHTQVFNEFKNTGDFRLVRPKYTLEQIWRNKLWPNLKNYYFEVSMSVQWECSWKNLENRRRSNYNNFSISVLYRRMAYCTPFVIFNWVYFLNSQSKIKVNLNKSKNKSNKICSLFEIGIEFCKNRRMSAIYRLLYFGHNYIFMKLTEFFLLSLKWLWIFCLLIAWSAFCWCIKLIGF